MAAGVNSGQAARAMLLATLMLAAAAGFIGWFPKPSHAIFWDRLYNTGHLLVLGALTLGLFSTLSPLFPQKPALQRILIATTLGALAGLALEIQQIFTERHADPADALRNVMGAVCAGAWLAYRQGVRHRALVVVAMLGAIAAALPLINAGLFYVQRYFRAPVLYAADDHWTGPQLSGRNIAVYTFDDCLLINKSDPTSSNVLRILDVYPDWVGAEQLVVSLDNPGQKPFTLTVRVADNYDTEIPGNFTERKYRVQPGWQELVWNIDAPLRLENDLRANRLDRMRYVQLLTPPNIGFPVYCLKQVRLD